MFLGHFVVGLAAPLFLDPLWPFSLLATRERVRIVPGDAAFTPLEFTYSPWSHSLLMSSFGASCSHSSISPSLAIGWARSPSDLLVVSHWVLDAVVHRPELPIAPGDAHFVGLGLCNPAAGTVIVGLLMFAAGVWLYATKTRPLHRLGRWALWSCVPLILVIDISDVTGPPPPSVRAVALATQAM